MAWPFSDEFPSAKPVWVGSNGPFYADNTEDILDENDVPYDKEQAVLANDLPATVQTVTLTRTQIVDNSTTGAVVARLDEVAARIMMSVEVSDITFGSTNELAGLSGNTEATLLLAYKSIYGGPNKATIYEWDTSVTSESRPQIVQGSGGYWVAIAGYAATAGSAGAHKLSDHELESGGYYELPERLIISGSSTANYFSVLNGSSFSRADMGIDGSDGGYIALYDSSNTAKVSLSASGDSYFLDHKVGFGTSSVDSKNYLQLKTSSDMPVVGLGGVRAQLSGGLQSDGYLVSVLGSNVYHNGSALASVDGTKGHAYISTGVQTTLDAYIRFGVNTTAGIIPDSMDLTETGLGIGTDPATRLHVYEPSASPSKIRVGNTEGDFDIIADSGGLGFYNNTLSDYGMFFESSGNVRINFGSRAANNDVEIEALAAADGRGLRVTRFGTATQYIDLWTYTKSQILASAGTKAFEIGNYGAGPLKLLTSNTERITVTSSGDVGIGTTSPSRKLDVSGNIGTTGSVAGFTFEPRGGTGDNFQWYNQSGTDARLWCNTSTDVLYVKNTGEFGVGKSPTKQFESVGRARIGDSTNTIVRNVSVAGLRIPGAGSNASYSFSGGYISIDTTTNVDVVCNVPMLSTDTVLKGFTVYLYETPGASPVALYYIYLNKTDTTGSSVAHSTLQSWVLQTASTDFTAYSTSGYYKAAYSLTTPQTVPAGQSIYLDFSVLKRDSSSNLYIYSADFEYEEVVY